MEGKSRFEVQREKMKKAQKILFKRIVIYGAIFYILAVIIGYFADVDSGYVMRTFFISIVLIILGMLAGMFMQKRLSEKLIPPPEERESPEMTELLNDEE